jgi:hypothetical protein
MLDVGDFAGGRRVGDIGGRVEEFTFQAGVAVDVGSDFHAFGENDVFPAHNGNAGVSAFGFAAGAKDSLIIVGEANAANENAEFAAAAESFFRFGFVDHAESVGAFGNDEKAVDDDVFENFEIHLVADLGGGGRKLFAKLHVNGSAVQQDNGLGWIGSVGWRRSRTAGLVIVNLFSDRSFRRSQNGLCAGSRFQKQERVLGDIAGFALGGANAEIAVVAAGDFHLLAALKSATDVERDHGAVEIDVVAGAGALDLADLLGFAMSRRKKKKQESKKTRVAQSGELEIKMDERFHTSISPQEVYRWQ